MNKSPKSNYILPIGKADQERLKILNEVFGKYSRASFDKVGLKKGQKVAIFGCGSGECIDYVYQKIGDEGKLLCIDISPEQIAPTKEVLTEKSILNVEYKVADIQDVRGDESYDLAYCRLVLIHVKQPRKGIKSMLSFVKRGGFIACDEYSANYRYCYPEAKVFQRIQKMTMRINKALGKDSIYGEKLYHKMLNFDVELVHFEFNMPIFNSARKKQLAITSWEGIKEKGVVRDIIQDKEIDEIISKLKEYQNDESMFQSSGGLFQYIGRKR